MTWRPTTSRSLRVAMAKRWGPVRMVTETTRIKSVFKYGHETGLIERPVRYGPEFKPPSRSVLRRHRAKTGGKMLEAAEIRRLLDAADLQMKAMILSRRQLRDGQHDCATLSQPGSRNRLVGLPATEDWHRSPLPALAGNRRGDPRHRRGPKTTRKIVPSSQRARYATHPRVGREPHRPRQPCGSRHYSSG